MTLSYRALILLGMICFLTIASDIPNALAQQVTLSCIIVLSFIAIGTTFQQEQ
ncbi:MAG: hypothetical protein JSV77_08655 [Dehalococcoidales bacterium]|nr:MAG: hypothetical protein JSV77_08655 [Dehalococcoidales bacterium]